MLKLPEGKWAYNYDKCIRCGTTKSRHRGKGVCFNCRAKEWNLAHSKDDKVIERRRKYPKIKKYIIRKKNLNFKYKCLRFLKNPEYKRKDWQGGLEVVINGKRIKTIVKPPKNVQNDNNKTFSKIELFKEAYSLYK